MFHINIDIYVEYCFLDLNCLLTVPDK